jgi:hypothetical protein
VRTVNLQELLAFLGRHPLLSLALAGLTLALLYIEVARLFQRFRTIKPAELTVLANREGAWWWTSARKRISSKATSPARATCR